MTDRTNNRIRAFADVVSIDAWHDSFSDNNSRARIFCDVAFRIARIGADPECPVRFRLALRRAEVHLVIPKSEPILVDQSTVARTDPDRPQTRTVITETSQEASIEAKGNLSISAKAGLKGTRKHGDKARNFERIEELRQEYSLIVRQNKSSEGNYRWEIHSAHIGGLVGKAWDPNEHRAVLIDTSEKSRYGLSPGGFGFEARCAREDLLVEDVQFKENGLLNRFVNGIIPKNKEIVAIQYIKDQIIKNGLEAQVVEDPFGLFTIASAVSGDQYV